MSNNTLKVQFGEQLRRVSINADNATYEEVYKLIKTLFKPALSGVLFSLSYRDDEGDNVVISSDIELKEAFNQTKNGVLRLIVDVKGKS
jgi:hypothetical protein